MKDHPAPLPVFNREQVLWVLTLHVWSIPWWGQGCAGHRGGGDGGSGCGFWPGQRLHVDALPGDVPCAVRGWRRWRVKRRCICPPWLGLPQLSGEEAIHSTHRFCFLVPWGELVHTAQQETRQKTSGPPPFKSVSWLCIHCPLLFNCQMVDSRLSGKVSQKHC